MPASMPSASRTRPFALRRRGRRDADIRRPSRRGDRLQLPSPFAGAYPDAATALSLFIPVPVDRDEPERPDTNEEDTKASEEAEGAAPELTNSYQVLHRCSFWLQLSRPADQPRRSGRRAVESSPLRVARDHPDHVPAGVVVRTRRLARSLTLVACAVRTHSRLRRSVAARHLPVRVSRRDRRLPPCTCCCIARGYPPTSVGTDE